MLTRRSAATVLEVLLGLAIFCLALALIWGLVRLAGRSGQKVETVHGAVMHAELAMGALAADLRSMLPPDPERNVVPYRVAASGRAIAFYRVEEVRGQLRAKPVVFEARPSAGGNLSLYRDGQKLSSVLSDFKVEVLSVVGTGKSIAKVLPRAAGTNPKLQVTIEGVSQDRPRAELAADAFHRLSQLFAVPETSPAATLDMPPVARELSRDAVRVDGTLPAL